MLFNSLTFLYIFLPIVYVVFWRLTTRQQRHVWLALTGYVFYSFWDYRFCLLMLFSTLVSYLAGLGFLRWSDARTRRWCLIVPVVLDLSLLGFFKYYNFFINSAGHAMSLFGWQLSLPRLDIILPVGISFYTFHTITYVIDSYRRVITPTRSLWEFMAYVSLFPQLVAGPIVRFRQIEKDLDDIDHANRIADANIAWGFFAIGLAKKVLIADTIARIINPALSHYDQLSTLGVWMCAVGYSYQLYFDFSGYSDMAVGLGYLLGLRIPQNFNSPYKAFDIADFWRRWHMSLSSFLRDYFYIPLGGSRGSELRTYRNLMITMLLGGLWHGAGWTFVVWGAYHGALLSLHRVTGQWWQRLPPFAARTATFVLVVIGFTIFRADTLPMAQTMIASMFTWRAGAGVIGGEALAVMLLTAGRIAHFGPNTFEIDYHWPPRRIAGAVVITAFCLLAIYGSQPRLSSTFSSSVTMGRAIPVLLAAFLAADVSARFLPVDPLAFRAWEALARYRPVGAAFEPDRRFLRDDSYGDAAALGNLPAKRQYRPEIFTTDERGFRNAEPVARDRVGVILTGDSFAVGSGVVDSATLAPALTARLGCRVYNAAGVPPDAKRLEIWRSSLGGAPGVVVHAYAEDNEIPTVPSDADRAIDRRVGYPFSPLAGPLGRVRGFLWVSPLQIAIERGFKQLANDRVLPNGYAANAIVKTLRNGDAMLFVASRVDHVRSTRAASIAYWQWLEAGLRPTGLRLVVVLIPSKYRIYGRLFADDAPASDAPPFLDRLGAALRNAGIPTIDLTAAVSAEAARRADQHEYLYWLDDIHWNGEGIQVAAEAMLSEETPLRTACAPARATIRAADSGHEVLR